MAFTVRSNSFKDGDYLGKEHILSADFGLAARRKQVPAPCVVGRACRHQELCGHLL